MDKILDLFGQDLKVINMGLDVFADALTRQGLDVTQMEWKPPAGGRKDLMELLDRLEEA